MPDPCETQETLEAVDTARDALAQLLPALEQWLQREMPTVDPIPVPVTAAHVIEKLYPERRESWPGDDKSRALRSAIEALTGTSTAQPPSAQQLGRGFAGIRGRVVDGRYVDTSSTRKGATKKWVVLHTKG